MRQPPIPRSEGESYEGLNQCQDALRYSVSVGRGKFNGIEENTFWGSNRSQLEIGL